MAWHGTELSLKALLTKKNTPFDYNHKMSDFMSLIDQNKLVTPPDLAILQSSVQAVTLSGSYTDLRYPGNDPEFWENMPIADQKTRVDAASNVYRIVSKYV